MQGEHLIQAREVCHKALVVKRIAWPESDLRVCIVENRDLVKDRPMHRPFELIRPKRFATALAFGLAAITAAVVPSGPAQAQAVNHTCASVGTHSFRNDAPILNLTLSIGDVVNVAVEDFIGTVKVTTPSAVITTPAQPFTLTATENGVYVFAQQAGGALISCPAPAAGSAFIDTQTTAVQTATSRNTQARLNGNGPNNQVTQNSVFLSTSNLPGAQSQFGQPELNAWVSLEGRSLNGATTGRTLDLVLGVDRLISSRLIVGALVAYGRQDLTAGATNTQVNSPSVGAYFATRLQGDWLADGYLSLARPAYDVNGATFTASRVSGSFAISGNYEGFGLDIAPFAKLNGYREAQPAYGAVAANDITRLNTSVGARLSPLAAFDSGVLPYISVAVDYGMTDSTAGGRDTYWAPRLGAGFSTALAGGFLSIDVDAGRIRSNVTDLGLRATYEMSF